MTVEQCVKRHAILTPSKTAVVFEGQSINYAELWAGVCRKKEELEADGLKRGALNIFAAPQSPEFLYIYLATHLIGAVAVPLERNCPDKKFRQIKQGYGGIILPTKDDELDNIADVLFTTGSTGKQKGVMESYNAIIADYNNLIDRQGFCSDTVFIICGPLNHIGSLSKIWPVLSLGGTLIILDGMKDMNAFVSAFEYPVNKLATFMVPASIRIMLQFGEERIKQLSEKIDFIETGGAAISQTDMDALCAILPDTRLYNTYASTETGIVCSYDYNHNPCVAGCTGLPMINSSVFITKEGTIACKGKTLMSGYLGDEKLTASVLHDGTMFTNDLGEIDSQGYLHIKGRNNDVINIGGYKVSPLEVEDIAISFPDITDCLCFLAHTPIFGDTVKLIYVAKDGIKISKKDLARYIASKTEAYKVPHIYEQVDNIKHTYNSKLDRKFYSR